MSDLKVRPDPLKRKAKSACLRLAGPSEDGRYVTANRDESVVAVETNKRKRFFCFWCPRIGFGRNRRTILGYVRGVPFGTQNGRLRLSAQCGEKAKPRPKEEAPPSKL